jgi:putative GTP pyrophosphokinase
MDGAEKSWEEEFRSEHASFDRLASEVEFALDALARKEAIKVHSIGSRVKSLASVAEKTERQELKDPLSEVKDIVGIRIVVLFLSDLPRLDTLIRSSFEIHDAEDKIVGGDPASFGYMSVHYLASLGSGHSGPRYDDLKHLTFEVQTRTVVMDAWANVSHHLDYKGSSSIPEELRKDFYALSGLFYVADQHFELFSERARDSQLRAQKELGTFIGEELELNLDTVEAYLNKRFKGRSHTERAYISEFVEEITAAGYQDLRQFARALDEANSAFLAYEKKYPPAGRDSDHAPRRFSDLGAARITLALADFDYAETAYMDVDEDEMILEFALWNADQVDPD